MPVQPNPNPCIAVEIGAKWGGFQDLQGRVPKNIKLRVREVKIFMGVDRFCV
jgi:hypothetical protein